MEGLTSITNTKIWFLLLSVVALFCAGCAAQIQQDEMARARAMANGDERLAALYYTQMEQNRVNAIMQMSQGLQNAGAIYAQGAHTEIPPVSVPQFQPVPIAPPGSPGNPIYVKPAGSNLISPNNPNIISPTNPNLIPTGGW